MVNNTIILWLNLFSLFLPRKNFDNNQINQNSAFGEILGQLCEYTLSNQMGIPKSSIIPVHGRFSVFNNEYFYNGVLDYNESRIQATYGVLAGFGIYLLKNYFARRRIPHLWCRYSRRRLCNAENCIGTNPSRKRYILISDRWQLSYHCRRFSLAKLFITFITQEFMELYDIFLKIRLYSATFSPLV